MAITRTRTVKIVEVRPRETAWIVKAIYNETFDDSEDDQLPITTERTVNLLRFTETTDENGNKVQNPTDISGEDAVVQAVCNAVWTD